MCCKSRQGRSSSSQGLGCSWAYAPRGAQLEVPADSNHWQRSARQSAGSTGGSGGRDSTGQGGAGGREAPIAVAGGRGPTEPGRRELPSSGQPGHDGSLGKSCSQSGGIKECGASRQAGGGWPHKGVRGKEKEIDANLGSALRQARQEATAAAELAAQRRAECDTASEVLGLAEADRAKEEEARTASLQGLVGKAASPGPPRGAPSAARLASIKLKIEEEKLKIKQMSLEMARIRSEDMEHDASAAGSGSGAGNGPQATGSGEPLQPATSRSLAAEPTVLAAPPVGAQAPGFDGYTFVNLTIVSPAAQ